MAEKRSQAGREPEEMKGPVTDGGDIENRKLTPGEKAGVTAAFLMFVGIGMIMGGSGAGKMGIFYAGTAIFTVGAIIALYLLFKNPPKDEGF